VWEGGGWLGSNQDNHVKTRPCSCPLIAGRHRVDESGGRSRTKGEMTIGSLPTYASITRSGITGKGAPRQRENKLLLVP